jgi:hypothetical protein
MSFSCCCSCRWGKTAATNGHIIYPPGDMSSLWRATVEYWQGKPEQLGQRPAPVPLSPLQIQHGLTRACTSETSVYFNETTWCYILEGCHLHTRRRKNLKTLIVRIAIKEVRRLLWSQNIHCHIHNSEQLRPPRDEAHGAGGCVWGGGGATANCCENGS